MFSCNFQIHEELARNLNQTMMSQYSVDPAVTQAVDAMQSDVSQSTHWRIYTLYMFKNQLKNVVFSMCYELLKRLLM